MGVRTRDEVSRRAGEGVGIVVKKGNRQLAEISSVGWSRCAPRGATRSVPSLLPDELFFDPKRA
jgi:hypothetical protein